MGRYSAAASPAGVNTANTVYGQLRPTTTASRLYIVEIGVSVQTAPTTAPNFYLARSTANGTVSTTLAGQAHDPADVAAIGTMDSVFSVAPTFSTTNKFKQGGLGTTAGGFLIWTFYDAPIVIDRTVASGLALVNANASGATLGTFTGHIAWEE